MDDRKIEEAVRLFLEGIGEDVNREGLWRRRRGLRVCAIRFTAGWSRIPESIC